MTHVNAVATHFALDWQKMLWQCHHMEKDTHIQIRITSAEKQAWLERAKVEGMTLSQYIRWIVGHVAGSRKA